MAQFRKPQKRTVIIFASILGAIVLALAAWLVVRALTPPQVDKTVPHTIITEPGKISTPLPTPTETPNPTPTATKTITATPKPPKVEIKPTTPPQYKTPDLALATTQAGLGYFQYCMYMPGTTKASHKAMMSPFYTKTSPRLDDFDSSIKTQSCTALSNTTTGSYKNGAINVHMLQHVVTTTKTGKSEGTYAVDAEMVYDKANNTFHIQNFVQTKEKK